MPSISSWLADMSRRKLHVAASSRDGLRDTLNLRRFVLLKNSITNAESPSPSPSLPSPQHLSLLPSNDVPAHTPVDSEACILSTSNINETSSSSQDSEEKWLESVLENLDEYDCEVEVKVTPVEEELAFLDFGLDDPFESWALPYDEYDEDNVDPLPFPFLSNDSSPVLPSIRSPTSFQLLLSSPKSPFVQPFSESRYPEADFDLPSSEGSSESDSDDDDDGGLLTPHGGSQSSLRDHNGIRPDIYTQPDSCFLYSSKLDLTSPPPYFRQC